jgi:predicted Zn-ribbon and HTH transcriptional regulator
MSDVIQIQQKPKFYDYVNVYDFVCELPGSKQQIHFKPVNTAQLKRLLTYENEKNLVLQEMALDELISSSIISENFNINDLYLEDRFFLLLELRKKTKGEILEFSLTCPECNSQSINRIDLNNLPIKEIDLGVNKIAELSRGIKVHLKYIKRSDQKEVKSHFFKKSMSETSQAAELQTYYHALSISKIETPNGIDVDDSLTLVDKKYFMDNIPLNEYEKIKEILEAMSFGVDLSYDTKCNKCEYEHKTTVPLENNFFS